jgi:hypothetical protein
MSYKILKSSDYKSITDNRIVIKGICKTSKTREFFTMDVYLLHEQKRMPLLVETPVLTIASSKFEKNTRNYFFIELRHIEYDKAIQEFYKLLTSIEHSIINKLSELYTLSQTLETVEMDKDNNFFIDTDKNVKLSVEYKKEVVSLYDRFKNKIKNEELIKHSRAQFILELPSIWFELDDKKEIIKFGLHWSALQIKIVEQCPIEVCLFEEEKPKILGPPIGVGGPPIGILGGPPIGILEGPPLGTFKGPPYGGFNPMVGFNPFNKIQAGDLLAGIGSLKKTEPIEKDKKQFKSKQTGGFTPPSLDDILSKLKSLKKS